MPIIKFLSFPVQYLTKGRNINKQRGQDYSIKDMKIGAIFSLISPYINL